MQRSASSTSIDIDGSTCLNTESTSRVRRFFFLTMFDDVVSTSSIHGRQHDPSTTRLRSPWRYYHDSSTILQRRRFTLLNCNSANPYSNCFRIRSPLLSHIGFRCTFVSVPADSYNYLRAISANSQIFNLAGYGDASWMIICLDRVAALVDGVPDAATGVLCASSASYHLHHHFLRVRIWDEFVRVPMVVA